MNVHAHAVKRFGRRVEFSPDILTAILDLYKQSRPATHEECLAFCVAEREGSGYWIATYQHLYTKQRTELILVSTNGEIRTVRTRYESHLWINRDLNMNSHNLRWRV